MAKKSKSKKAPPRGRKKAVKKKAAKKAVKKSVKKAKKSDVLDPTGGFNGL